MPMLCVNLSSSSSAAVLQFVPADTVLSWHFYWQSLRTLESKSPFPAAVQVSCQETGVVPWTVSS